MVCAIGGGVGGCQGAGWIGFEVPGCRQGQEEGVGGDSGGVVEGERLKALSLAACIGSAELKACGRSAAGYCIRADSAGVRRRRDSPWLRDRGREAEGGA